MAEKVCTCCGISKPNTNEFFYLEGRHAAKCRKCKNSTVGDKHILTFRNTVLNDNWKAHPRVDFIYFERDSEKIFNMKTGKYLANPRSFVNLTKENVKVIKWETFYGPTTIPNKIVKNKKDTSSICLDDLEYEYIYCESCFDILESPTHLSRYCSKRCQLDMKNEKANNKRHSELIVYLKSKLGTQKLINNQRFLEIDYDVNHLKSLGMNCFYCGIECSFGNEEYTPGGLTFDRKDSSIEYSKENVVQCCWFCNMVKNTTEYSEWMQCIDFLKNPETLVLDLSDQIFSKKSRVFDISGIYGTLRKKSPEYYPESGSAKQTFLELVKKQNYTDSIFHFFPIIYLDRNCLWNASIDAIDSSGDNKHKHRPDNLQIIPKFMNYGKHIHSQEQFLKEWEKRGFKTNFENCTVKLPEGYSTSCYFNKIIN